MRLEYFSLRKNNIEKNISPLQLRFIDRVGPFNIKHKILPVYEMSLVRFHHVISSINFSSNVLLQKTNFQF